MVSSAYFRIIFPIWIFNLCHLRCGYPPLFYKHLKLFGDLIPASESDYRPLCLPASNGLTSSLANRVRLIDSRQLTSKSNLYCILSVFMDIFIYSSFFFLAFPTISSNCGEDTPSLTFTFETSHPNQQSFCSDSNLPFTSDGWFFWILFPFVLYFIFYLEIFHYYPWTAFFTV